MSNIPRIGGFQPTTAYTNIQPASHAVDTSPVEGAKAGKKAAAVNLFDASTFHKAITVDDGSGKPTTLPSLSDEEMAQAQGLFAQIPDDKKDAINAASQSLGQALFAQLSAAAPAKLTADGGDDGSMSAPGISRLNAGSGSAVQAVTAGNQAAVGAAITVNKPSPAVISATQNAAAAYSSASSNPSGNGIVMATAYMGVAGLQGELGDFADNMQATIDTKKSYDADAQELNEAVNNWPEGVDTQVLPKVTVNQDGTVTVTQVAMTKAQAADSAKAAATASQNTGADQQIQMIQMQQIQSSYTNAVNMISNIMKSGYEMTKNTIGNIHY